MKPTHEELEATCAAMREASQGMVAFLGCVIQGADPVNLDPERKVAEAFNRALSSDAGGAYLERMERMEKALRRIAEYVGGDERKPTSVLVSIGREARAALIADITDPLVAKMQTPKAKQAGRELFTAESIGPGTEGDEP